MIRPFAKPKLSADWFKQLVPGEAGQLWGKHSRRAQLERGGLRGSGRLARPHSFRRTNKQTSSGAPRPALRYLPPHTPAASAPCPFNARNELWYLYPCRCAYNPFSSSLEHRSYLHSCAPRCTRSTFSSARVPLRRRKHSTLSAMLRITLVNAGNLLKFLAQK